MTTTTYPNPFTIDIMPRVGQIAATDNQVLNEAARALHAYVVGYCAQGRNEDEHQRFWDACDTLHRLGIFDRCPPRPEPVDLASLIDRY